MPGRLAAVVGASGVGKDTLLAAARHRLSTDSRFVFARRVITRPSEGHAHAGSEQHMPLSIGAFQDRVEAGGFALHWQAHGLHYGIPIGIELSLAAGKVVVANLSRAVLMDVPSSYCMRVIEITAPMHLRFARLNGRRRETAGDIDARLRRSSPLLAAWNAMEIPNDTSPEEGSERLIDALLALC